MQRKEFLKQSSLISLGLMLQQMFGKAHPFVPGDLSKNVIFYTKKDKDYNLLRQGFNRRVDKFPDIVAVCFNTKGVQEAMLYANEFKMGVRVKSGGHCMEGFSTGNGGMQIVLKELNKIEWISSYKIKVGPACLLHTLNEELIPKNRILPGGSCATVAIGGLTLGGGYGLLSRLFGLTCDSLEAITMVDGSGNIVSSKQNSELLWACKGGANGNFGIITEMVFKVHNRPSIMSSYRFRSFNVDTNRGKAILKAWFEESKKLPKACFSTCLFNGNTAYILLTNVSKLTPVVQQFIKKMKVISDKFTTNVNQPLAKALKNYYGEQQPILFKNASSGLYKSFDDIEPIIERMLDIVFKTKGMIYQVNTLGGAIQNKDFELTSSFPHRAFAYFSELQTYWESPSKGETQMNQFEEIQKLVASQGIKAQYRNYPDVNFQQPLQSYYADNLTRLQLVKKQFDPKNSIRHEQSITLSLE